jgi:transposase-like protein
MNTESAMPRTLQQAIPYFSDPDVCLEFMKGIRWPDGVTCPYCAGKEHNFIKTARVWQCKACKKRFSIKVGTVMEDSPIGLDKWLPAIWLIAGAKTGISSCELHRALGVTQKTAWFMLHRIRLAMQNGSIEKMSGTVEADETFIGGKARNMHKGKRKMAGRGTTGKAVVMGLLERNENGKSRVKTKHVKDTKRSTLHKEIAVCVEHGSHVFTDAFRRMRTWTADIFMPRLTMRNVML